MHRLLCHKDNLSIGEALKGKDGNWFDTGPMSFPLWWEKVYPVKSKAVWGAKLKALGIPVALLKEYEPNAFSREELGPFIVGWLAWIGRVPPHDSVGWRNVREKFTNSEGTIEWANIS